jgi:predicted nucleic acid-binding protein
MTCPLCGSSNVSIPLTIRRPSETLQSWRCYRCGHTWQTAGTPPPASNWRRATLGAGASCLVWLGLALLVWLDAARPVVEGPHVEAFWGAVIGWIASAFGWLGAHAASLAVIIYHVTVLVARALFEFGMALGGILGRVGSFLQRFWRAVLRPALAATWRAVDHVRRILDSAVRPVLRILARIRAEFLKYYDRFFRPLLDTIELTRQTFGILARLHVPFAKAIEDKLWDLEDRLTRPIIAIMRRLNEVSDWINRIVTLDGTFQRVTLLRSMWRHQRDTLAIWWHSIHRPLSPAQRADYDRPLDTRSIAAVGADLRAYVERHEGPDVARIDEHAHDLRIRLSAP